MGVTEVADRFLIPPLTDAAALHASRIDAPVRKLAGATMGTGWSLSFAAAETVSNAAVVAELEAVFALAIRQMSNWEAGSDICAFNRAERGWRELQPEFFEVLAHALKVAGLTEGAFDPALAREMDRLGFGPGEDIGRKSRLPKETPLCLPPFSGEDPGVRTYPIADIRCRIEGRSSLSNSHNAVLTPERGETEGGLSPRAGWRDLWLAPETQSAFQPGGVELDLSSIAKGYAVDLCAERLGDLGVPSFLIEVGGEFKGRGVRPDGQPWRVELKLSDLDAAEGEPQRTVAALVDMSVATSGDFVRRRDVAGHSAPHILDGRTRQPVGGELSGVCVLHPSCMNADAWATALMALGPKKGLATAEAQGLAAVFALRASEGARFALSSQAAEMSA